MESGTLTPPSTDTPSTENPDAAAAQTKTERLYKWSSWVHVGAGATNCEAVDEEKGTNECSNPTHFHAWCRLPNPIQHEELREKALAAQARRTRQLKDPETDGYVVLEAEIESLAADGDAVKPVLIDELIQRDWYKEYLEAVKDVRELEGEGEGDEKLYPHVEEDQRRVAELGKLPEDERPKDEWEELERHLGAYHDAVQKRYEEISAPRRKALEDRDLNSLLDLVREDRIQTQGNETFSSTYNRWAWFTCTLRAPGGERAFASIDVIRDAAEEVLRSIDAVFQDLEGGRNRELLGNS